ncbi:site-specific integrase [Mesorhizobium sp. WSM3626]|uniref:site-specific integrase n=1 Tax=Mesorhizobium sp. WSM3626 TaxID=1040987 RepID=UPI000486B2ED|nr:site-specific integrase [Mesorhizobium sp. WSM3626]
MLPVERLAETMILTSQGGLPGMSADVQRLISASLSDGTKRGYQNDIAHFEDWGGIVPAPPETVAAYLAELSATYRTATIVRRVTALSKAHDAIGAPNPTKSEIVRATMRGIKRTLGTATKEAKPVLREDLFQMLERMGDGAKDIRDKALLLLGFAGAFRRSELVGLDIADIEHVRQGIVVTLRRSKTDQIGAGRKIGIPFGRSKWCPVKHLTEWLDQAKIETGPLFRGVNRHGYVAEQRLSGEAVCIIVKQRAEAAGFDPGGYSGHSLRAGLATSAAMAGASAWKIRAQTGHASDAMLARYIRDGDMFTSNAAGAVL